MTTLPGHIERPTGAPISEYFFRTPPKRGRDFSPLRGAATRRRRRAKRSDRRTCGPGRLRIGSAVSRPAGRAASAVAGPRQMGAVGITSSADPGPAVSAEGTLG